MFFFDYMFVLLCVFMILFNVCNWEMVLEFLDFLLVLEGVLVFWKVLLISLMLESDDGSEGEMFSLMVLWLIGLLFVFMVIFDVMIWDNFLRWWWIIFFEL